MTCWCTQGFARISPSGNFITLSSALLKHPEQRTCCSFFEEAVPGLTVLSQPNPEAPEVSLLSPFCSLSPHFSTAKSLRLPGKDSPPSGAWGAGLPRHLPCLYCFQSFNLSPQASPSGPLIVLSAIPGSSNLPAVMRCPVPSTVLQVPPTRAPHEGTTVLLTHPVFSVPFFFFSFSDHHSKLKQHGKAKQPKSKSNA